MSSRMEQDFWLLFSVSAEELAKEISKNNLRAAFDRVEVMLRQHGFDFAFELTKEGNDSVLVLTPEGDQREAQLIDELIKAMPKIPGWRVYPRRQRKPLSDAFAFVRNIYGVDISEATFDLRKSSARYEVVMSSSSLADLEPDEVKGLIGTFLDHAIGEDAAMTLIVGVSGQSSGRLHFSPANLVEKLLGSQ